MKKRVLSIILVICMMLTLVPYASAAENYGSAPDFPLYFTDGSSCQLSDVIGNGYIVLIFGRLGETICGNTASQVNFMDNLLTDSKYSELFVYMVDITNSNADAVSANLNAYAPNHNVTACVSSDPSEYMQEAFSYTNKCNESYNILPFIFIIDPNGDIAATTNGTENLRPIIDELLEIRSNPLELIDAYTGSSYYGFANDDEWEVLKFTNKLRAAGGLLPLSIFPEMQTAAGTRANETLQVFDHVRPDGNSIYTVFEQAGINGYYTAGENIAYGYISADNVVNGWRNSPGHYANIMDDDFVHMGAGYDCTNTGTKYWVQLFLTKTCSFSGIELLNADNLTYSAGASLDDLGIIVRLTCSDHGYCYIPLIEEMCSGFDKNAIGNQRITVNYGSLSTSFDLNTTESQATYTVRYHANGGTDAPAPQTKFFDEPLIITYEEPFRFGYNFVGWADSPYSYDAIFTSGDLYYQDADLTLYALWEKSTPNFYTVTYNANGGTDVPDSQTKTHGEDLIISYEEPVRKGYTFKYWVIYTNTSSIKFYPGDIYSFDANATLYAVWEKESVKTQIHTVIWNCPDAGYAFDVLHGTKPYFGDIPAKKSNNSNYEYVFVGWSTDEDATSGTAERELPPVTDDIVYYAIFRLEANLSTASNWAKNELSKAVKSGLVPIEVQNYQNPLARENIARLIITLIEEVTGKSIETVMKEKGVSYSYNFTDTFNIYALMANALGIINGVGDGRFDPDGILTRAQIAAIINRIAAVLGKNTSNYSHSFTDVKGHWCSKELGWPVHANIINGVGNNKFNPNGILTTEQTIVIIYRTYEYFTAN